MQQKLLNNRYELEQKIGEGGMARVYRGRDLRLNRRVAVKVLHSHFAADTSFLSRFQHEAQAAAILSHPNVVDVYDVGQDGEIHYIVMEYVDGQDLKALIMREAPLSAERAVAIGEAVALGLEAAHRVGLVHRDIKPQNIMVGPDGQVRISDFGIAKSHLSTAMTETGVTFGTADYVAPEQAQGQKATPQSDIYSLGVVLYEMLTARLPFTGENAIAVAMQQVSATPVPLHRINPAVPPQLEALVLRAMAKDSAQRPATAQEFARLLHNYRTLSVQDTALGSVVRSPGGPPPGRQPAPPRPGTGNTGGRMSIPPPPSRAAQARSSQQQGVGCGGFLLGFVLLAGVLGAVLLFGTGALDGLFPAFAAVPARPTARLAITTTAATAVAPTRPLTPSIGASPLPLVTVPNIAGKSEEDAQRDLFALQLIPVRGGETSDPLIAAGSVISQTVRAGSQLATGQNVTYTLSTGPLATVVPPTPTVVLVAVPDYVQAALSFAQSDSSGRGISVRVVDQQPSTSVDENFIISQRPQPGSRVEPGTVVQLVVSRGNKVQVPRLKGLTEEQAKAKLAEAAARGGVVYSYSDYQGRDKLGDLFDQVPPGTVVSSQPGEDEWVAPGTPVTLGVRAP